MHNKKEMLEKVIEKLCKIKPNLYESMLKEIILSKNKELFPIAISLMEKYAIDYDWVQVEYIPKPLYLVILQSGVAEIIQKYFDLTGNIRDIYYGELENADTVTLCEVYLGMGKYKNAETAFNRMNLYYSNEDHSYVDSLLNNGYVPLYFLSPKNEGYLVDIIRKIIGCNISVEKKKKLIFDFISSDKVLFIHNDLIELLALSSLFDESEFQELLNYLYSKVQSKKIKFLVNKNLDEMERECICVASEEEISALMKQNIETNKSFQKVKLNSNFSIVGV